jgi:hypothetical protein
MQIVTPFVSFYATIESDVRIGTSHISLYMALLHQYNLFGDSNSVEILRDDIMRLAKIYSRKTYHRCIRDLHEFGYIKYHPAINASVISKVILNCCENDKKEM